MSNALGCATRSRSTFPIVFEDQDHTWYGGVGDVTLGLKRVLFSNLRSGSILSLQGGFLLPTGSTKRGFGSGTTTFEPFAAFDQIFRSNTFLQLQFGADLPFNTSKAPQSWFFNSAIGQSLAPDHWLGRLWSPMCEFLATRDLVDGAKTDWDVMPEMQVTISKRQHVRGSLGLSHSRDQHSRTAAAGHVLSAVGLGGRELAQGMVMRRRIFQPGAVAACVLLPLRWLRASQDEPQVEFHTSDRCMACHNQLTTPNGPGRLHRHRLAYQHHGEFRA